MIPILTLEPMINQEEREQSHLFSYQNQKEFLFLEIVSISFYSFIWWYFQWNHYKKSSTCHKWLKNIPNWLLSLFAPLLSSIIFFSAAEKAKLEKVRFDWDPTIISIIYLVSWLLFIIALITHLHYPFFFVIGVLRFIPLYFVQGTINQICEKYPLNASQNLSGKLTYTTIISGSLLWASILCGTVISMIPKLTIAKLALHQHSYEFAHQLLLKEAYDGNAEAQSELATLYLHGIIQSPDEAAMKWYERAANQEHAFAYLGLGVIYQYGLGPTKDYNKAIKYYEEAIEHGAISAITQLARLYEYTTVLPNHTETAFKLYEKAAKIGDPEAQYRLGNQYLNGLGVSKNINIGLDWVKKSANYGCPCAQIFLGNLAMKDLKDPNHRKIAAKWFEAVVQNQRLQWIYSVHGSKVLTRKEYEQGYVNYMIAQSEGNTFHAENLSLAQRNLAKFLAEKLEKQCTPGNEDSEPDIELYV